MTPIRLRLEVPDMRAWAAPIRLRLAEAKIGANVLKYLHIFPRDSTRTKLEPNWSQIHFRIHDARTANWSQIGASLGVCSGLRVRANSLGATGGGRGLGLYRLRAAAVYASGS